jgi:hypothetical protein
MSAAIPTEADWEAWPANAERWLGLDEAYARKRFEGKSFEEALHLFRTSQVLSCSEDVSYMPPVPFRFYILVFKEHVMAEAGGGAQSDASDAASSFLNLVERKLTEDVGFIAPIMAELTPAVEFVAKNQTLYRADKDIYGDFLEQLARIQKLQGA